MIYHFQKYYSNSTNNCNKMVKRQMGPLIFSIKHDWIWMCSHVPH